MRVSNRKGWPLIIEVLVTTTTVAGVFLLLMFFTKVGTIFPDFLKLWAPIGIWVVTVAFYLMHRTPDGHIDIKVWSRKEE
jgi:hypothetical protein